MYGQILASYRNKTMKYIHVIIECTANLKTLDS